MLVNFTLNGQPARWTSSPTKRLCMRCGGMRCSASSTAAKPANAARAPCWWTAEPLDIVHRAGRPGRRPCGDDARSVRRQARELSALQQAFIETGAIQCGYCTPAQILCAPSPVGTQPHPPRPRCARPSRGVLCRCTGYVKPVQAILRAAAVLRGEDVPPIDAATDVERDPRTARAVRPAHRRPAEVPSEGAFGGGTACRRVSGLSC